MTIIPTNSPNNVLPVHDGLQVKEMDADDACLSSTRTARARGLRLNVYDALSSCLRRITLLLPYQHSTGTFPDIAADQIALLPSLH